MLTIAFIILQFTDSLLLSWWWIILTIFLDLLAIQKVDNAYRAGHQRGYEEAKEEYEGERPTQSPTEDDWEFISTKDEDSSP